MKYKEKKIQITKLESEITETKKVIRKRKKEKKGLENNIHEAQET